MKATDLMIGDWYQWYAEGNYYPFQVNATNFGNDYVANFEPIPLTAEILEKNGFLYDGGEIWFIEWEDKDGKHCLNFRKMYDIVTDIWNALGIMTSGEVVLITSVHELQHALRMCGLHELADNFKLS